ncbi:hypothetical protein K474DRAFT_405056 [Panus rudis PR-1116 ss-1]|nr:hypothetical protein K474DRAFT_405056 [Panus rudis PR-1116 ss-1]
MEVGDIQEVVTFFQLKEIACYLTITSMFLILYDCVLTISQEVELIWRSCWSYPKLVFLLNRYSSVLFAVSYLCTVVSGRRSSSRYVWQSTSCPLGWFSMVLVQVVLQTWIHAIYNKRHNLVVGLAAMHIACGALSFASLYMSMSNLRIVSYAPVCTALMDTIAVGPSVLDIVREACGQNTPPFLAATLLSSLALSAAMVGLLTYKAVATWFPCSCQEGNLSMILIRDSTISCFVILLMCIYNACLITVARAELVQAGVGFGIALPSIASSRMLLNLRHAHSQRQPMDLHELQTSRFILYQET